MVRKGGNPFRKDDEGKHSDTNKGRSAKRMNRDKDAAAELGRAIESAKKSKKSGGEKIVRKIIGKDEK